MFANSTGNPFAHSHVISSFGYRLEHLRPGSTTGHPARLEPLSMDTLPSWMRNIELDLQLCQIPRFWWIETAMLYLPKATRSRMNKRRQAFQEKDYSDWSWRQFQENLQAVVKPSAPGPPAAQTTRRTIFKLRFFMPGGRHTVKH